MIDDRPWHAHDFDQLAAEAERSVVQRVEGFAKLVERRGEDAAAAELRVWRAIAAEWHFVVNHARVEDAAEASQAERIAMLEQSHRRATAKLKKEQDRLPRAILPDVEKFPAVALRNIHGERIEPYLDAWHRREMLAALLWWQRREGVDSIDFIARLNIQLRKARDDRAASAQAEAA